MTGSLENAVADHRRGHPHRAIPVYEATLVSDPDRHDVLHLLGVAHLQVGQAVQSRMRLARAVELAPEVAVYHVSLGEALRALGNHDQTLTCLREAIRLSPDCAEAYCNLGATLVDLDRPDEGIAAFREAIRLNPDLAAAHNNLAGVLARLGEIDSALDHYRIAAHLDPMGSEIRSNLGRVLIEKGEPKEALEQALAAVRLQPTRADSYLPLANALTLLGRLQEAEACLREAIRLMPHFGSAWAALAGVLEQRGDLEGSLTCLHETLRHDPKHAGALGKLASRLRKDLPERDRRLIETLIDDPGVPDDQRRGLAFGLAIACDAAAEYDRAAALAARANALQEAELIRRGRAYDPLANQAKVDSLIEGFSSDFFRRVKGFGLETEVPVFVVGLPRSGTSLVEQILACHPSVFGAGELMLMPETFHRLPDPGMSVKHRLSRLDRASVERLAGEHLRQLASLGPPSARVVDKLPENTKFLGLIATLFPRARIIHCRRDPRDVGLSCWMTDFGQLRWACRLDHIVAHFSSTQHLMNHWRQVLPVPILEVAYEQVVDDLEGQTRRLLDWCGLPWDPACLAFHQAQREVRTASAAQVRRPLYRDSVGRWRRYEDLLGTFFDRIASLG